MLKINFRYTKRDNAEIREASHLTPHLPALQRARLPPGIMKSRTLLLRKRETPTHLTTYILVSTGPNEKDSTATIWAAGASEEAATAAAWAPKAVKMTA